MTLQVSLSLGSAETTINVEAKGKDLVEKEPTFHTDIDQALTDRLPIESMTSSVSSLVILLAPWIRGGLKRPDPWIGDHAETLFLWTTSPFQTNPMT